MKSPLCFALFVFAETLSLGSAFAANPTVILPGSKITFTKTLEFQNPASHPASDFFLGETVQAGERSNQYCSITVQLGAGAKGRIPAGRTYVTQPLGRDQEYFDRDAIALSDKVVISCYRENFFSGDYEGDTVTKEALTRSMPFLKVEPKQAPDEEL